MIIASNMNQLLSILGIVRNHSKFSLRKYQQMASRRSRLKNATCGKAPSSQNLYSIVLLKLVVTTPFTYLTSKLLRFSTDIGRTFLNIALNLIIYFSHYSSGFQAASKRAVLLMHERQKRGRAKLQHEAPPPLMNTLVWNRPTQPTGPKWATLLLRRTWKKLCMFPFFSWLLCYET